MNLDLRSPPVVVALVVAAAALVLLLAPAFAPPPPLEDSAYGYSVSLSTNATLENVTLYVPLPDTPNGRSPVVAAVGNGTADAPDSWTYDVVATDRGRLLRIRASEIVAERRPDGRRDGSYLFGVQAPAAAVVDTDDPFGREPTMGLTDGRSEIPCPNLVEPVPEQHCYQFDPAVYAAYDAPADADVDVYVITNGVNTYRDRSHAMYYERVTVFLDGPQKGWVTAEGFARTEPSP